MMDTIYRTLGWLLTVESVGIIASFLASLGIPPTMAFLIVVFGALIALNKFTSDRYMVQRWRRKLGGWRQWLKSYGRR